VTDLSVSPISVMADLGLNVSCNAALNQSSRHLKYSFLAVKSRAISPCIQACYIGHIFPNFIGMRSYPAAADYGYLPQAIYNHGSNLASDLASKVYVSETLEPCIFQLSRLCAMPFAGTLVGCIVMDATDGAGCQTFRAGGVVAVPANTLHSAENPGCTPAKAMQALSGGVSPVLYDYQLSWNPSSVISLPLDPIGRACY